MITLKVSDERSLNQAISAKVNNLQVTDQAFEICRDALKQSEAKKTQAVNKQKTFDDLYQRMRLALKGQNGKKRAQLQNQITSQYMIREVPSGKAYELIRDTLV